MDRFQLVLADEQEDYVAENLKNALINYTNHVFDRGGFARVSHTVERLTIQRLAYFCIDIETSRKLLRTLCSTTEEVYSQQEDQTKIHLIIENEVNALVRRYEFSQYPLPIFALCCDGTHLSDYSLTYDNRRALHIEEILFLDHQCNPICHLFSDSQGHFENLSIMSKAKDDASKKRNQMPKKKSSQRQGTPGESIVNKLEASSLTSHCAISLVSTSQDVDFGWGIGGYHVNALYDQFLPSNLPSTTNDIYLQAKNIDILLSSDGIPKIIQTIVPLMLVLYKNFFINSIPTDSTLLDSSAEFRQPNSEALQIKRSFRVSFDCAHFVLALERQYLSELSFTGANLNSRGQNSDHGRIWRFSLDLCEIHDLSPSGSVHPSILTKDPETLTPMLLATFVESESKMDVSLLFTGLRFCVLYRYLLEVMIFSTTHFTDVIVSELTKFSDGIKSGDIQLSDVESLTPSADDSSTGEQEIETESFHGQKKFHGGFFEYPDCGNGIEDKEPPRQMRGSLNMFGIESLKLQRSRTTDTIGNHSPNRSHSLDCLSEPPATKSVWRVQFRQTTLLFPRNSCCDDLLGVTIRNVNFFQKRRKVSWPDPPAEFKLFNQKEILYFNFYKNEWTKGFAQEFHNEVRMEHTPDLKKLSKRNISVDTEQDMQFYSASEGEESDFDEFQDAVSEPMTHVKQSKDQSFMEPTHLFSEDEEPDSPISRYIFEMEGVDIFSSIAGPYEVQSRKINPVQMFHRRFQPIKDGKPVYSIISSKRLTSWSKQCWKRISTCPSNILLLVEMTSLTMRILISETEIPSSINFQLAMSDLYLLMSIYYDNLNELSDICSTAKDTVTNNDSPHQSPEYPEYGTEEFCEYVRTILSTTDILVVRSDLQLNCSMDNPNNSIFSRNVPNLNYLFEVPVDLLNCPDLPEFPFATIRLQWLIISCRMNADILQVAIGAAEGELTDVRSLQGVNGKKLLKFYPRSTSEFSGKRLRIFDHGFANFDFGLKDSPQSIRTTGNIPFQITYFSVGYSWGLCNIGSDAPDFDFHNLSMVWLLSDYFSLYFSYPEFGNSSLSPRKPFEQSLFQYFGIDTRVFITRPHLQTSKLSSPLMETLVFEAEKGIYYRYIYDSDNSVKMELDISDLSLVLMKQYRSPSMSRGIRGVAGSGKQIRTLVEFASIQFESQLDAKETTLDYILRIGPEIHEKSLAGEPEPPITPPRTYVDFGTEFLFLPSVSLPPPKCVSPLYIPPRIFPKQSCRITTSYEDVLLTIDLVMGCIGLATEPQAKAEVNEFGGFNSFMIARNLYQNQRLSLEASRILQFSFYLKFTL